MSRRVCRYYQQPGARQFAIRNVRADFGYLHAGDRQSSAASSAGHKRRDFAQEVQPIIKIDAKALARKPALLVRQKFALVESKARVELADLRVTEGFGGRVPRSTSWRKLRHRADGIIRIAFDCRTRPSSVLAAADDRTTCAIG